MPINPEQLLISSVLRDKNLNEAIASGVSPFMFRAYKDEWAWICDYNSRYHRCPSKEAFKNRFPGFRLKVVNDTAHFSEEVRIRYARHQLVGTIKSVSALLAEGDISTAVSEIQMSAIKIGADITGVRDSNFAEDWESIYKDVEARVQRFNEDGMAGVPTGFEVYDSRTGGLMAGQLTIVASRFANGKSWTLMEMASAALMDGFTAHFSSLEMRKGEVGMRMHNIMSGLMGEKVFQAINLAQGKNIDLKEYKAFLRRMRTTVKGQLTISDTRGIGIPEVAAHIERYKPDVYFLDYLTLARMKGEGGWKDIGDFTKGLKDLAGGTGTSIVAAAQLNRGEVGQQNAARSADNLSGSDQIGQDADNVITQRKMSDTIYQYHVPKARGTRDGFGWYTRLDLDEGIFETVSPDRVDDLIDKDKHRASQEEGRVI